VGFALLALTAGCARNPPEGPTLPPVEGESIAAALTEGTRLADTAQIFFDWAISEQGRRGTGKGVTRVQPPYRARLDLFLEDGTTAAAVALVDGNVSAAETLPEGVIPPPDLLWAALGVFKPGSESTLASARHVGSETELRYTSGAGQELVYRVQGQRIVRAQVLQGGNVVHQVTLTSEEGARFPREATYQNRAERRELKLTTSSIEDADAFPVDIWFPRP
jgi:hypothetical protein